jgi:hypothetical protein
LVFAISLEYVSFGQSTHAPAPVVFLNLPATHAEHIDAVVVMAPV